MKVKMVSLDSVTKALVLPTTHVFVVLPFSSSTSSSVTRHCDSQTSTGEELVLDRHGEGA